jgi:hypothetical protein
MWVVWQTLSSQRDHYRGLWLQTVTLYPHDCFVSISYCRGPFTSRGDDVANVCVHYSDRHKLRCDIREMVLTGRGQNCGDAVCDLIAYD